MSTLLVLCSALLICVIVTAYADLSGLGAFYTGARSSIYSIDIADDAGADAVKASCDSLFSALPDAALLMISHCDSAANTAIIGASARPDSDVVDYDYYFGDSDIFSGIGDARLNAFISSRLADTYNNIDLPVSSVLINGNAFAVSGAADFYFTGREQGALMGGADALRPDIAGSDGALKPVDSLTGEPDNDAFFSVNFRFASWAGIGMDSPPAYDRLVSTLNALPDAGACAVNFKTAYIGDEKQAAGLYIYPQSLFDAVATPLSAGEFCDACAYPDRIPVVLDSRLRGRYDIGDAFNMDITSLQSSRREYLAQIPAIVTGFLDGANDCITTHGASNSGSIDIFVSQMDDGDDYAVLAAEHPLLKDLSYTGGHGALILLPTSGTASDHIEQWREGIAPLNLGMIESYADVLYNDTFDIAVLQNADLFLVCIWLIILTCTGLAGHCLMQTSLWSRRTAVYELLGMTKLRLIGYIWAAGYLPLCMANCAGLLAGNLMVSSMYSNLNLSTVRFSMSAVVLIITALPHAAAFAADCIRTYRTDALTLWNARS